MQAPVDVLARQIGAGSDQGVGETRQMAHVVVQHLSHVGVAFGAGADDELDRYSPRIVGRGPSEGRGEIGGEDLAHRRLTLVAGGGLMQHPGALTVQLCGPPTEDLEQQGVLRPKVIVDAGKVDASRGGDVAHRDILKPVQRKQLLGRHEHSRLGGSLSVLGLVGRVGERGIGHAIPCCQCGDTSPVRRGRQKARALGPLARCNPPIDIIM